MDIVVCVKHVAAPESQFKVDPLTNVLDEKGLRYELNPNDEFAVEEALRVKDKLGEGQVTAITLGPPRARDALVRCLAMGADQAFHIHDEAFEESDVHVTSIILARVINRLGYGLVFCGGEAWDDGQGYVPAGLAEELGTPLVTGVTEVESVLDSEGARVLRLLEKGDQERVECSLPAVFAVAMAANRPRYPTLRNRLRALRQEIPCWDRKIIGLEEEEVGASGSLTRLIRVSYPRPRAKKLAAPDSSLPVSQRLNFFLSGGVSQKESNLLDGSTDEAAAKVVEFLMDESIISGKGVT